MRYEDRVIQSSLLAGMTDIVIGFIMYITSWHEWYWERFHTFGVLGIGMVAYGTWHAILKWRQQ